MGRDKVDSSKYFQNTCQFNNIPCLYRSKTIQVSSSYIIYMYVYGSPCILTDLTSQILLHV